MKVLALGLGRTGTTSLRAALIQLGYTDTYHMQSASIENPPDCLLWRDAFAAKFDGVGRFGKADWDSLLGHCMAVSDWPAIAFAEELIEAYPDAQVILTTREINSWYHSVLRTVDWRANDPELRLLSKIDWAARLYHPMLRKFWNTFFCGDFKQHGRRRFVEHHEHIRSLVPAERLLEFNVADGWEPLCQFLDKPVPESLFPRENAADNFVQRCKRSNRRQALNVLVWMSIMFFCFVLGVAIGFATYRSPISIMTRTLLDKFKSIQVCQSWKTI